MREKQRYQEKLKREKQKAAKQRVNGKSETGKKASPSNQSKTHSTLLSIIERVKKSHDSEDKETGGFNPFSYENFVKNG